MKKNRPGVLLAVQCRPADADELASIVFRETTALGLRRSMVSRLTLPRRSVTVETPFGPIAGIAATLPGGALRFSPEYEACADAARRHNIPLEAVQQAAKQSAI
jgi:pyridinium-3,5-bisthiocarboxylic acid mononucleotide nickel chelatase